MLQFSYAVGRRFQSSRFVSPLLLLIDSKMLIGIMVLNSIINGFVTLLLPQVLVLHMLYLVQCARLQIPFERT